MNKLSGLVSMAIKPARVAWSVGIVAVLAACWGGGDAPAPMVATANVVVGATNITPTQKTQTASVLVAVTSGGTTATPLTFATGFSGTDATGAAVALPAIPTQVTFTANTADATQPKFTLTSAEGQATGTTVIGSCTFKVTFTTFKAPHPMSVVGAEFKVDPCTVTMLTNGIAADGTARDVGSNGTFGTSSSLTAIIQTKINTDGTIEVNRLIVTNVTVPTGGTTTTTAAATTTTAVATTTTARATTTTAIATSTTAAATTTTAAATTTTAAATTTTAAATTTTAAATTTTAATTTSTAATTTTSSTSSTVSSTTTTTQPAVTAGPTLSLVTSDGATLTVTSNQTGTGYYLVQLATAATPSYALVRVTGTSFALTANVAAQPNFTGLNSSTNYNLYFIPMNSAGSYGQMQFVAFTTAYSSTGTTGTTGSTTGTATTGGSPP